MQVYYFNALIENGFYDNSKQAAEAIWRELRSVTEEEGRSVTEEGGRSVTKDGGRSVTDEGVEVSPRKE